MSLEQDREKIVNFLKAKTIKRDPNSESFNTEPRTDKLNTREQAAKGVDSILNDRSHKSTQFSSLGEQNTVNVKQNKPTGPHHYVGITGDNQTFNDPHHLLQFNVNHQKPVKNPKSLDPSVSEDFLNAIHDILPQFKNKVGDQNFNQKFHSHLTTTGRGQDVDLYNLLKPHAQYEPQRTINPEEHDTIHGKNISQAIETASQLKSSSYTGGGASDVSKAIINRSIADARGKASYAKGKLLPELEMMAQNHKGLNFLLTKGKDGPELIKNIESGHLGRAQAHLSDLLKNRTNNLYRSLVKDKKFTPDEMESASDRRVLHAKRQAVMNKLKELGDDDSVEKLGEMENLIAAQKTVSSLSQTHEDIKVAHHRASLAGGLGNHEWSYVQGPRGAHYIINHTTGKALKITSHTDEHGNRHFQYTPGHDVGIGGQNYKLPSFEHPEDIALRLKPPTGMTDEESPALSVGSQARYENINVPHSEEVYHPFSKIFSSKSDKTVDPADQSAEGYSQRVSGFSHAEAPRYIGHMVLHGLDRDQLNNSDDYQKLKDALTGQGDSNVHDIAALSGKILSEADPDSATGRLGHVLTQLSAKNEYSENPEDYDTEISFQVAPSLVRGIIDRSGVEDPALKSQMAQVLPGPEGIQKSQEILGNFLTSQLGSIPKGKKSLEKILAKKDMSDQSNFWQHALDTHKALGETNPQKQTMQLQKHLVDFGLGNVEPSLQHKLQHLHHLQNISELKQAGIPQSQVDQEIFKNKESLRRQLYHQFTPPYLQDTVGGKMQRHYQTLLNNRNYHDLKGVQNTLNDYESPDTQILKTVLGTKAYTNLKDYITSHINGVEQGDRRMDKLTKEVVPSSDHVRTMIYTMLKHQAHKWTPEQTNAVKQYLSSTKNRLPDDYFDRAQDTLKELDRKIAKMPRLIDKATDPDEQKRLIQARQDLVDQKNNLSESIKNREKTPKNWAQFESGQKVSDLPSGSPEHLLHGLMDSLFERSHTPEYAHHESVLNNATQQFKDYQNNLMKYGNIQSQNDRMGLGSTYHGHALRNMLKNLAYTTSSGYSNFDRKVAGGVVGSLDLNANSELYQSFKKTASKMGMTDAQFKDLLQNGSNANPRTASLALKAINQLKETIPSGSQRDQLDDLTGSVAAKLSKDPENFKDLGQQAYSRVLMRGAGTVKTPVYAKNKEGKFILDGNGNRIVERYERKPMSTSYLHGLHEINNKNLNSRQYDLLNDAQAHEAARSIMGSDNPHWVAQTGFHAGAQNVGRGLDLSNQRLTKDLINQMAEKGVPVSAPVRPAYNTEGLSPSHYISDADKNFVWSDPEHKPITPDMGPGQKQSAIYKNAQHTMGQLQDALKQIAKEPDEEEVEDTDPWVKGHPQAKQIAHINKLYNIASKLFGNEPNAIVRDYLREAPKNNQDALSKFMGLHHDSRLSHHDVAQLPGMQSVRDLTNLNTIFTPSVKRVISTIMPEDSQLHKMLLNPETNPDDLMDSVNHALSVAGDPALTHRVNDLLGSKAAEQLEQARTQVPENIDYKKPTTPEAKYRDLQRKMRYLHSLVSNGPATAVNDLMDAHKGKILQQMIQRDMSGLRQDSTNTRFQNEISDIAGAVNNIVGSQRTPGLLHQNLHNMGTYTRKAKSLIDQDADKDIISLHNSFSPERMNELLALGNNHPGYHRHLTQYLNEKLDNYITQYKDTPITPEMREAIKQAQMKDPSIPNIKAGTLGKLAQDLSEGREAGSDKHLHNVSKVFSVLSDMVKSAQNPSSSLGEIEGYDEKGMTAPQRDLVAKQLFGVNSQDEINKPRDAHEWRRLSEKLDDLLPGESTDEDYRSHLKQMAALRGIKIKDDQIPSFVEHLKDIKKHINTNFAYPEGKDEGQDILRDVKHHLLDKIVRTMFGQVEAMNQLKGNQTEGLYQGAINKDLADRGMLAFDTHKPMPHSVKDPIVLNRETGRHYYPIGGGDQPQNEKDLKQTLDRIGQVRNQLATMPNSPEKLTLQREERNLQDRRSRLEDLVNNGVQPEPEQQQALLYPAKPEFFGSTPENMREEASKHFGKYLAPGNDEEAYALSKMIYPLLHIIHNDDIDERPDAPKAYIALSPHSHSADLNNRISRLLEQEETERQPIQSTPVKTPKVAK